MGILDGLKRKIGWNKSKSYEFSINWTVRQLAHNDSLPFGHDPEPGHLLVIRQPIISTESNLDDGLKWSLKRETQRSIQVTIGGDVRNVPERVFIIDSIVR